MKSLKLQKPHMIVLVGIPGAGKSHFGSNFAEVFNLPILSTEKLKQYGSERAMLYLLQEMIKTKSHFIYDGDASSKKLRDALSIIAEKSGYDILFVWLQTELFTAKDRYETKTRKNDFEKLTNEFNPPIQNGKVLVISGKHAFSTQMRMVLGRLVESRAKKPVPSAPPRKTSPTRR